MFRIGYVPKWLCTEFNMSRNGVYRSGHVPKRPARPAPHEQYSGNPSRIAMSTSVAKVYSLFKVSLFFLLNRINSTCMLFLSIYTFIILTMRLCAHRNRCNELNEARIWYPQTPRAYLPTHLGLPEQSRRQSRDLLIFICPAAGDLMSLGIHLFYVWLARDNPGKIVNLINVPPPIG